jgi:hypothetical protein
MHAADYDHSDLLGSEVTGLNATSAPAQPDRASTRLA